MYSTAPLRWGQTAGRRTASIPSEVGGRVASILIIADCVDVAVVEGSPARALKAATTRFPRCIDDRRVEETQPVVLTSAARVTSGSHVKVALS
jgi:hypothetical protein